ncbi:hypothetical protein ACHAQA_009346 [Verticillium albo-atrum]
MLAKSILVLASLALAAAKPVRRQEGSSCALRVPTLPVNGGATELASPPEGSVLKHIALGHGIQNYTCVAGQPAKATGAVAVLYDATALYPRRSPNSLPTVDHFNALTTTALWSTPLPLNSDGTTEFGASATEPFQASAPLEIPGHSIPFLGLHYFDGAGVPTFLTGTSEADSDNVLKAFKVGDAPAPASADPGPVGTGAVPWLYLGGNPESRGFSLVYRVITAGGKPKTCTDDKPQSVPYATYYWLYGNDA